MTTDTTSFITYYLRSLGERTRAEKLGTKFGFDWIIYNLALADDLIPYRLPFFRGSPKETSKTKTETEYGVDLSFLSSDGTCLTIFVLKDETLTNTTWTANDFDADLRRAVAPDLTPVEFRDVRDVRVVLAYNKDESHVGIELYQNLIRSFGTKVGDNVQLTFERWNLTTLTERVKSKLLTPALLPQRFFSLFSYICSQFGDFTHGSDEWSNQLISNWRRFLQDLLQDNADERTVRLLPVALLILREHGRGNPSTETGWIDLIEWTMIACWQVHQTTSNEAVKVAVQHMWLGFYVAELDRYYEAHDSELGSEHSLEENRSNSFVDAVVAAVRAYWHIARLGILATSLAEFIIPADDAENAAKVNALRQVANRLASLINANSGALRPLIDLHHIEFFLIWRTFWQIGRRDDISSWLRGLRNCLVLRRAGAVPLPFIEGHNSMEAVFEFVASGERPTDFCDQSCGLVMVVLELCFSLEVSQRDELIGGYYQEIVLGMDSNGSPLKDSKPINLMAWGPPVDWDKNVLVRSLAAEGESQALERFDGEVPINGAKIAAKIQAFVLQSRTAHKAPPFPDGLPVSVIALGCLKLRSPLPPELWRRSIWKVG